MKRVVITGLGVVSPVGNGQKDFWEGLTQGRSGIGPITRFDTENFKVKIAAEVKNFDPLQYMDKFEAKKTDLYTKYAIAATEEAMTDSGLTVKGERLGVYIGSGVGGINTFYTEAVKLHTKGPGRVSPLFIPMMIGNIAAGTIAIRFEAQGPCLPVVSACATGTHSIGEAFRAIAHGYAAAIIAGGAEAAINPMTIAGFTNCLALTTRNDCERASIPFDKERDGFVVGDGAGIVILEEYEHAVNRGAKIYAEIKGYGNTCDAHHITAPHPEGRPAFRAMALAMQEADLTEAEKLYINAHGTSTPLNDKTETIAIKQALGERAYEAKISSTKSMTGHMLGAAGAVEAIASALALHTGILPPTIGYREKDPDCDLDYVPNQAEDFRPEAALSNSFGFGGQNACLALIRFSE